MGQRARLEREGTALALLGGRSQTKGIKRRDRLRTLESQVGDRDRTGDIKF